jgi:leader peptidase (prepilin peptidase)/N-methyltransferase
MGFGDVKLGFLIGFFLGWPAVVVALFSAFFIGAIIGIVLIMFKKKKLKSEVPFGPFLIIGTFLGAFFSRAIINYYLSLLL